MATKVRLTRQARDDLKDIGAYIGQDNPARAATFIREIHVKAQAYADHPDMGRDRADLAPKIRSFPYGSYAVFYRHYRRGIQIVRVYHAGRDITPEVFVG